MSSGNDLRREQVDRLALDAGEQVLAVLRAHDRALGRLPPAAYENLLVVSSARPADVERRVRELDADPSSVGLIPVSASPVEYDGDVWATEAIAPDDLTGLSMRLSRAMDALAPGHGWLLVDSVDVFLLYADEDRVFPFLDHVAGQAAERDVRGVYAVARDAVDDRAFSNLRRAVDREVDLR